MKRLILGIILVCVPILCSFVNESKKDIPAICSTNIEQNQIVTANANKISNVINAIAPHIDKKLSEEYGIIIDKYSQQYDINWKIVVAIFKQESDFDIKAVNYRSRDFGIGQIHYRNIIRLEINLGKLLTDADYAIHQTFLFLKTIKLRYYHKEIGWYSRYNSGTPPIRKKYQRKLNRKFLLIKRALKNEEARTHGRTIGVNVPKVEGNKQFNSSC